MYCTYYTTEKDSFQEKRDFFPFFFWDCKQILKVCLPWRSKDWSDQSDIITAPSRRQWDMQLTSPLMLLVHECRERGTVFFCVKIAIFATFSKKQ